MKLENFISKKISQAQLKSSYVEQLKNVRETDKNDTQKKVVLKKEEQTEQFFQLDKETIAIILGVFFLIVLVFVIKRKNNGRTDR